MAGTAAGDLEEALHGGGQLVPEQLQALLDEINALRRDPKGYAEAQAQKGSSAVAVKLMDGLQDLRSAAPMPELTLSQALSLACHQHLADLMENGGQSHVGKDGSTPETRVSRVGAHREQCSENLVFGVRSAKDAVHQMIMDDGSVEREQCANLLNPDFRYAGVAWGELPSGGHAVVLLFTDHFRAKQASHADVQRGVLMNMPGGRSEASGAMGASSDEGAQRSWDMLMQQIKPAHLKVPQERLAHVEFMTNPKLYGQDRTKVPLVPTGDLQPRPSVDPAVARAFVFRLDADQDDLITEKDIEALCYRKQLNIGKAETAQMFDEIVQRRQMCDQERRMVDYAEVFAAMQTQKHWVPVTDLHVQRGDDVYQLIVDSEALDAWIGQMQTEFCKKYEGLELSAMRSEGGRRNRQAEVRIAELNTFLASVLAAKAADDGALLQLEPRVTAFLAPPGRPREQGTEFQSVICLGQRRLWAYRLRPHREAWLRLFRAVDLHPLLPLAAADQRYHPAEKQEVKPAQPANLARTSPVKKMTVRDPPQKLRVRPDKTEVPSPPAGSTKLQPWQEKQQQIENSVNGCIASEASMGASSPCIGFEAQRKFNQVLFMQKYGVNASDAAQQLDGEQDTLAREVSLSQRPRGLEGSSARLGPTAARRSLGGSAPPSGQRGHGAGSHSLQAHNGVRSHFHNTVAVHSSSASQNGLSALDVRWEGSHVDHTKLQPQKADAKFSTMGLEERARQFSSYFRGASLDCAALKAQTASNHAYDAQPYQDWAPYEFRSDIPHRHGKHGRRHFDPQVQEKPVYNRHFISEIENKPHEEFERHAERVHDYLHRKLPQGQERHFQTYLPQLQKPSKYEELATRQPVRSANVDGVVKRNALGFGQMRHSGPGDPNLYARPLGASQMDRMIPLA